jgi:hypothetical protein
MARGLSLLLKSPLLIEHGPRCVKTRIQSIRSERVPALPRPDDRVQSTDIRVHCIDKLSRASRCRTRRSPDESAEPGVVARHREHELVGHVADLLRLNTGSPDRTAFRVGLSARTEVLPRAQSARAALARTSPSSADRPVSTAYVEDRESKQSCRYRWSRQECRPLEVSRTSV